MDLGLQGRTALITGSHRGTGAAIANVLAAEGATVVVHGWEPGQPDPIVADILAAGGTAHGVITDLTDDGSVDELAEQWAASVDILICNYGTALAGRWPRTTEEAATERWVEAYEHNVLSAVRLIERFRAPMTAKGWGRIIVLGTMGTLRPAARMPQYYSAKSALTGMIVSLAQELAGTGVTANLISPGLIGTAEVKARLAGRSPADAFGSALAPLTTDLTTPEEVAALAAFIASDLARSITGTNFRIDGGAARTVTA